MLERWRIPCSSGYVGMLYLLDPPGLLTAFGCGHISVSERQGTFTLARGQQSLRLTRGPLTKLLFGPERVSGFAEDVFPLPFWQWPLDHV